MTDDTDRAIVDTAAQHTYGETVDEFEARIRAEERETAKQALIWMSGSNDFSPGGKAREGFEKIVLPLLAAETDDTVKTDYGRGFRDRAAVAGEIDRTLSRLLTPDADREELWPLIYEYGAAIEAEAAAQARQGMVTWDESVRAAQMAAAQAEARVRELEKALLRIATAAGDDTSGIDHPGQLVAPAIEELALRAVRDLRADYDGALAAAPPASEPRNEGRCPACYDSFSGPWCDNCQRWPCICPRPALRRDAAEHEGGE